MKTLSLQWSLVVVSGLMVNCEEPTSLISKNESPIPMSNAASFGGVLNGGGGSINGNASKNYGGTIAVGRCKNGGCTGTTNSPAGGLSNASFAGEHNSSSSDEILLGFSCNGVADGSLAKWLSSGKVEIAGTWNDVTSDSQVDQYSLAHEYADWYLPIDDAIGGVFGDETWEEAATGAYDDRWTKTVASIKKNWAPRDPSLLNIRFAHEFNLDGSDWRVTGDDAENFKLAWRRFYRIFKASLPSASLVWCPNDGTSGDLELDIRDAYPGDDYVDVICIDTYNQWRWVNDAASFDEKLQGTYENGAPLGAEAWRKFAEAQGKPLAIGEWSSNGDPNAEGDGGDSPGYIEWFHDWLIEHAGNSAGKIKYAVFFNSWEQFQVFPETIQPRAAAAVQTLF